MSKPLGIADTIEVLTQLGETVNNIVLIGGQALNFWAEQFAPKASALADEGPYTSKDIDFCGTQEHLRHCARALNGRAEYQSTEARSLCVGVVHYVDADCEARQLDFLSKPYGLETEPVVEMSFPVTVTAEAGRQATIRVMHPLHCFMSRVANVGGLEKYQTDRGVKQLRAAILCLRAFLEGQLDAGEATVVKKLNEKVFNFCLDSEYAQAVFELYGIEPFDAVLHGDDRLPAMFSGRRYPQMVALIVRRRAGAG